MPRLRVILTGMLALAALSACGRDDAAETAASAPGEDAPQAQEAPAAPRHTIREGGECG